MPSLRAANEGQADVASHDQLLAIIFQVHFAAVHRSGIRIEDIAATVLIACGSNISNDDHAHYGLILSVVTGGTAARAT
jgi:hypothetical protein